MQYLMLLIGFVCLIKGADLFVEGSSSIAKKFKIPSMIIGLTIVAMGTSAPEAAVSITSSLAGQNDMSVANVVGSNLFNILMVLGISSLISKLPVNKNTIKKDTPFLIAITFGLLIILIDSHISILEGLIMLSVFVWFIFDMIKTARNNEDDNNDIKEVSMIKTIIYIILGIIGIVFGGDLTVDSASMIANQFGLSQNLIGLTIVAVGTSLPEFITSLIAVKKGENDIAIGNVIGSNIFNIIFVLGISSVIKPIDVSINAVIDVMFLVIVTSLLFMDMKKEETITKSSGKTYIITYIIYILYTIVR